MSELVSALWFEDTGFLHEAMLDTPVGRFSIRQMSIFLVFGLLAWLSSLAFANLVLKIVVACAVFFAGVAIFTRKIKTISPEAHLLYLTKRLITQIRQKRSVTKRRAGCGANFNVYDALNYFMGVCKNCWNSKRPHRKNYSKQKFQSKHKQHPHTNGTTDQDGYFATYFNNINSFYKFSLAFNVNNVTRYIIIIIHHKHINTKKQPTLQQAKKQK